MLYFLLMSEDDRSSEGVFEFNHSRHCVGDCSQDRSR
jgi:hypothetical protein